MKRLIFALLVSACVIGGCGSKGESAPEAETSEEKKGSLVADLEAGEPEEVEGAEATIDETAEGGESVEETGSDEDFVPTDESQANIQAILDAEKQKEEDRASLGEVLTVQDYKYAKGTLTLSVEKMKDSGKKKAVFKYTTSDDVEFKVAYNAVNRFAEALLDNGYITEAEVKHGSDSYKVTYSGKGNASYATSIGGKSGSSKSDMPAHKEYDSYSGSDKELYTNIMRDCFTFLKLV